MDLRRFWMALPTAFLMAFLGCRSCGCGGKDEIAAGSKTTPAPLTKPAEEALGPEKTEAESAARTTGGAREGAFEKRVVDEGREMTAGQRIPLLETHPVTPEELSDPAFPDKMPVGARKATIVLKKLQEKDPRFKRLPAGERKVPEGVDHGSFEDY